MHIKSTLKSVQHFVFGNSSPLCNKLVFFTSIIIITTITDFFPLLSHFYSSSFETIFKSCFSRNCPFYLGFRIYLVKVAYIICIRFFKILDPSVLTCPVSLPMLICALVLCLFVWRTESSFVHFLRKPAADIVVHVDLLSTAVSSHLW